MKKFALTGNPVQHSKSPALFRAAYGNCSDMSYELLPAQSAAEAMELFHWYNLTGMNVTAPFKTDILNYVDEQSKEVLLIGATNTIIRQHNGRTKAYNTDHYGVINTFNEFNIPLYNKRCLLLGIGGAGKAAAYALSTANANVCIANRSLEHAQEFASKLNCDAIQLSAVETVFKDFDIIVSTLYPTVDCIDKNWLLPHQIVFDASYTGSPLLEKARQQGCTCIDGKHWLLHQAVAAFLLFTDIKPDVVAMRRLMF